jgi:hypothetical protein
LPAMHGKDRECPRLRLVYLGVLTVLLGTIDRVTPPGVETLCHRGMGRDPDASRRRSAPRRAGARHRRAGPDH